MTIKFKSILAALIIIISTSCASKKCCTVTCHEDLYFKYNPIWLVDSKNFSYFTDHKMMLTSEEVDKIKYQLSHDEYIIKNGVLLIRSDIYFDICFVANITKKAGLKFDEKTALKLRETNTNHLGSLEGNRGQPGQPPAINLTVIGDR